MFSYYLYPWVFEVKNEVLIYRVEILVLDELFSKNWFNPDEVLCEQISMCLLGAMEAFYLQSIAYIMLLSCLMSLVWSACVNSIRIL